MSQLDLPGQPGRPADPADATRPVAAAPAPRATRRRRAVQAAAEPRPVVTGAMAKATAPKAAVKRKAADQPRPAVQPKAVAGPSAKPKAAAKPQAGTSPAPAAKPDAASKTTKQKDKLVRDSFTMPRADFALIAQLKDRALGFKRATKKSELLRAGLQALAALPDAALQKLLDSLTTLKAGRPKKGG